MEAKLQKRLNDNRDRLFYTVYDPVSKNYYDLFEFKRFKDIPILERTIFKFFSKTFNDLFSTRDYDFNFFKVSLFLSHNISLNGKGEEIKDIEYKISTLLKDIYLQLRWQDLFNIINSFKGKVTVDGVEALKEHILSMNIQKFSIATINAYTTLKNNLNYAGDDEPLFKECLMLVIYDEYQRALARTKSVNDKMEKLSKNSKNGNLSLEDIELLDEIIALSNEQI